MGLPVSSSMPDGYDWFCNKTSTISGLKTFAIYPIDIGFKWAKELNGGQSDLEKSLHSAVKAASGFFALPLMLEDINGLRHDCIDVTRMTTPQAKAIKSLGITSNIGSFGQHFADFSKFVINSGAPASETFTAALGLTSTSCMGLCSGIGVARSGIEISKSVEQINDPTLPKSIRKIEEVRLVRNSLALTKSALYFILAIIGIVGAVLAGTAVISPFIGLTVFTLAVALSMTITIYEKVANYQKRTWV